MNQDNQTWYTIDDAADYLRCSNRSIRRFIQNGSLHSTRMESKGGIRIHRKWLDAFMMGLNAKRMSPVQKRLLEDLYN
jgi:excisionase family DNA binding protein